MKIWKLVVQDFTKINIINAVRKNLDLESNIFFSRIYNYFSLMGQCFRQMCVFFLTVYVFVTCSVILAKQLF